MRDDVLLLQDIIEAGQVILEFVDGLTYDEFTTDRKTKDAVVRNFEVIGEAAGNVSEATQKQYPDVEWEKMKGLRNILIHQYFGINYQLVWEIIENFLPQTLSQLPEDL